jgi:pimeloyl-ACP methyl ester carboxylesterase
MALHINLYERENDSRKTTLTLLIHGLGAPYTFTGKNNWKDTILTDQKLAGTDVGVVTYNTGKIAKGILGKDFSPIEELAQELKAELGLSEYQHYNDIVIVGHSMGGLVGIRYLLEELKRKRKTKIKSFISLATPFNGSHIADYNRLIKWMTPEHEQINQLEPNSVFLSEVNRMWIDIHKEESNIEFVFGYGTDDKVVEKTSAIPNIMTDTWDAVPMDGNHTTILNLSSRSYKIVRDKIMKVATQKVVEVDTEDAVLKEQGLTEGKPWNRNVSQLYYLNIPKLSIFMGMQGYEIGPFPKFETLHSLGMELTRIMIGFRELLDKISPNAHKIDDLEFDDIKVDFLVDFNGEFKAHNGKYLYPEEKLQIGKEPFLSSAINDYKVIMTLNHKWVTTSTSFRTLSQKGNFAGLGTVKGKDEETKEVFVSPLFIGIPKHLDLFESYRMMNY